MPGLVYNCADDGGGIVSDSYDDKIMMMFSSTNFDSKLTGSF